MAGGYVDQDARTVDTKGAKTFRTFFMPVVEGALEIVAEWMRELTYDHAWGPDDPLFPPTEMGLDEGGGFAPVGLSRDVLETTRAGARGLPAGVRGGGPALLQPTFAARNDGPARDGAQPDA